MRNGIVRKGLVLGITILFIGASIIYVKNCSAIGNTIYVDDNSECPGNGTIEWPYCKIQYAIDNASDGDNVFVYSGTYYEYLIVNKSINLIGENKDDTTIDGSKTESGSPLHLVLITSSSVTIENFTIAHTPKTGYEHGIQINDPLVSNIYLEDIYISNCTIKNTTSGIKVRNVSNCSITNCNITNNWGDSIWVQYKSDNIAIKNCTMSYNGYYIDPPEFYNGGIRLEGDLLYQVTNISISYCNINNIIEFGIVMDESKNVEIHNNSIYNNINRGIYATNLENLDIHHNNIYGNADFCGIRLERSANCTIRNNTIRENGKDRQWGRPGGILVGNCLNGVTIKNNNISSNDFHGIYISNTWDNIILNNTLLSNTNEEAGYGILFINSSNNNITGNTISNSLLYGILLPVVNCTNNTICGNTIAYTNQGKGLMISGSNNNNNLIYHNNFINNTQHAYDSSTNSWDNGYPSGGNYWDDYTGTDDGGDGIGDTPYPIPGGDNEDNYPLMSPKYHPEFNFPPSKPIKPDGSTIIKKNVSYEYDTYTIDVNDDQVYYKWNWSDGTYSEWLGPYDSGVTSVASHNWSQWGFYDISVKAKDVYDEESEWSDGLCIYVRLFPFFTICPSAYSPSSQTVYFNDMSKSYYQIVNWTWDFGDGNLSYTQNTSHTYNADGIYNVTLTVTDNESGSDGSYQLVYIDSVQPEITNVTDTPDTAGFGFNVTIAADVTDNASGVDTVYVNITYPNNNTGNFTMSSTGNNTYEYVFNDTWLVGQYNYTIWAVDNAGNTNSSSGHSFNVSANATISVCTIKNSYGNNETVNLTDPPGDPSLVGYKLLDDGDVLRIWNIYDSYYFNTSSGIQLTNHYDEYWLHNVLMLGYYNNDEWNLIYRTDELSGFNKNISTDNETYVNATLWKDLTYEGYDFRLAIRYHLGVDDNELTVIPYIKNIDDEDIPYTLGFGWEMKDIQIDMTETGDYIDVNQTMYYLNQTLNNTYTNLSEPEFYLMENITNTSTKSLYLRWNQSLTYKLQVKSRTGQYNAPVTLFVRIGTLNAGQEKYTKMYWYDADQVTYYFDGYATGVAWTTSPGNMVDGSTSNYASTTTDSDVELCNGNTCSGSDLGRISKVEVRCFGKYSGFGQWPPDIIIRPVFSGGSGSNHVFDPSTTGDWSSWFDITFDPNSPGTWSWTYVDNLDCDVEASIDGSYTVYCSKVEVRVTYTPNNAPIISNPYPSDGSTGISISPRLNITVSDPDGDNMNITWLSNSSGSWQVFGTNNSVGNGTYHQTFSNATVNGQWWYWLVNVTDGTNYTESSVYKFYTGYQSKINNTGSTNIRGYLLIQVQYYNETSQEWVVADDTINETSPRSINWDDPYSQGEPNVLALDTIFNGLVNTSNLSEYGSGTYRIYAAFRDPNGNVLVCDDETQLVATYEFTITFE